jgi:CubicO group peptidase (beta-lactamase class C family)
MRSMTNPIRIQRRSPVFVLACGAGVLVAAMAAASAAADAPSSTASAAAAAPAVGLELRTPGGSTFKAARSWTVRPMSQGQVLTAPEGDATIAIVDAAGADADAATANAWRALQTGAVRPLRVVTPQAPRNGWEERRVATYESSPNERMTVLAFAWRAGAHWVVTIVQASDPTYEKRGAQVGLVLGSLRPPGYERETFAGKTARPLDAARIEEMRAFVERGMQQLGVPGVGWSLIDHGQVVFEGGSGVRELGRPDKVDADTLFIAASNTKALTTLLIAELVDAGKLRWDEPVTQAYPAFKLGSAETTRQVLVKHLICACTGVPRQDMEALFEFKDATPASSMTLLGTMQPTSAFGEVFQYSNLMAAAAGYVGASLVAPGVELGRAYDEAMRDKVFGPLGMTRTTFDFKRALATNHASPHGEDVDGKIAVSAMDLNYSFVPVRPAGGVWTSSHDLSRYVQMELADGKLADGRTLVSKANLLARRAPQISVGEDIDYGMGLFVDTHWGVPIVSHGGDLAGYHSNMMWLPEHGVGATILTNSDPGYALRAPFMRKLVELLFDAKPEAEAMLTAAVAQKKATRAAERARLVVPADPAEAAKLAGRYRNAALGTIDVRRKADGTLSFDFGEWSSDVASRKNDDGTLSYITISPSTEGFEFVVAGQDGKRSLMMRDSQHEYLFVEL